MPEFHDREPEHQEWKRGVLAVEIELEEIDTTPYNLPSEPDAGREVQGEGHHARASRGGRDRRRLIVALAARQFVGQVVETETAERQRVHVP